MHFSATLDRPSLAPMRHDDAPWWAEVLPTPASPPPLILVMEDNSRLLELLVRQLPPMSYHCDLASHGQRMCSGFGHQWPALVILDWRPRGESAVSVVSAIRESHGATVPILIIAASTDAEAVENAGADAFLRRPYFAKALSGMVHTLLAD
jgi:DNA-binding response OmpR family regulator